MNHLRGQFLQETLYEDWAEVPRQQVHQFVRGLVLPIITADAVDADIRVRLGTRLIALDEFDEAAHLATANALAASGRKVAAVNMLRGLRDRIEREFSEAVPEALETTMRSIQTRVT
jgi:DNA-binding SARP family transcriptional activator